ncbi:hypothetical protein [Myxococcus sp. RHSTA-1-4]|uniref:hypothetical protein n=1 Tax=Myxococcus sp. RHSTA-1-4 TaxID=2874601 RepID=UPI001CBF8DB2|nr:hypothetical protein [Myxococcus sp. RHSTA-1-4]MBZ4422819.1 hypothetical protein [Myxococcus sp. RHSTA-1-4]
MFLSPIISLPRASSLSEIWKYLGDTPPHRLVGDAPLEKFCQQTTELLQRILKAEESIRLALRKQRVRKNRSQPVSAQLEISRESTSAESALLEGVRPRPTRDLALDIIVGDSPINLGMEPDQLLFCLGFHWLAPRPPDEMPWTGTRLAQTLRSRVETIRQTAQLALVDPLLWTASWDADQTLAQIRIMSLMGSLSENTDSVAGLDRQPTEDAGRFQISGQVQGISAALWLYPQIGIAKGYAIVLNRGDSLDSAQERLKSLIDELSQALAQRNLKLSSGFSRRPPTPTKR